VDVFEAIEERHSYRGPWEPTPVPRSDLEAILKAGIAAPSGYNDQLASFIAVDDSEVITRLARIVGNKTIASAPVLIVVLMDTEGSGRELYFGIEDYSAATENMLLAVTALGYASVWIDGVLRREGRAKRVAEALGVPPRYEVRVVLPVGRPAEQRRQKPKKPFDERVSFNSYSTPK
jgi:nitroreductase